MMELFIQGRACPAGGTSAAGGREGGASLEARVSGWLRGSTRERSALAYGAGFAGVLYLFRYSLAPLALSLAEPHLGVAVVLILVWGLLAPAALALSFAAGAS